jgi:hypothetical protein
MNGASALLKPVPALIAVGLVVALLSQGEHPAPSSASIVRPRLGLDATSDAEARSMRRVTHGLAVELGTASRCDVHLSVRAFEACVAPGLRHAGVGGRGAAVILGNVARTIPAGRCLSYLLGLQAANDAAADNARWLLGNIYVFRPRERRRELTRQLRLAYSMLRRSTRAGAPDVCSPAGGQPAI